MASATLKACLPEPPSPLISSLLPSYKHPRAKIVFEVLILRSDWLTVRLGFLSPSAFFLGEVRTGRGLLAWVRRLFLAALFFLVAINDAFKTNQVDSFVLNRYHNPL